MRGIFSERPSPALLVAIIALIVALSGSAYAALGKNTIGSKQLKKGAVKTVDIKKNAVTGAKVKESTLGKVPNADKLDGIDSTAFTRVASSAIANNALSGTDGTARSVSITAPQNGFLLAIASADVFGGADDIYNCRINLDGADIAASRRDSAIEGANDSEENCGTNAVASVGAGGHTVNFNFAGLAGGTIVDETELDVAFIPLAG
jgi:hypothetical protein